MSRLTYTYKDEFVSGGEPEDPEDRWTSYSDEYWEWELQDVHISGAFDWAPCGRILDEVWHDCEVQVGDFVYVVVVTYGSGDTFRTSHGHGTVACFCVDAESARAAKAAILHDDVPTDGSGNAPWKGYFERLEDVTVITKQVLPEKA
jgi:hypothetical protein